MATPELFSFTFGFSRSVRPRPLSWPSILSLLGLNIYLGISFSVPPDEGGKRGGGGADREDALGKELVLFVKDDLHCPSSFGSSSSTGLISAVIDEGSHSNDNYNDETRALRNRLPRIENQGPQTAPVRPENIAMNNSAANRKKGLLSSFYTIAEKLLVFCGSLVILSLSYPLATNSKESFEDLGMQGIIIGSVISFFISCLLTALASYLKDSESIKGIGFQIFKWLVLLVFLFICAGLCMILHFCAHTSKSVLWSLGAVGYIVIVSIWVCVFYKQVPQIQEEMKKAYETENRILYEVSDIVPRSAAPRLPV